MKIKNNKTKLKDYTSLLKLYNSLEEKDLSFIRKKNKKMGFGDEKLLRFDVLKRLGRLKYRQPEESKSYVDMLKKIYYGESIKHLLQKKELKDDIDDLNCINPEDYADEDGWF